MDEALNLYNSGVKYWNRNEVENARIYMDKVFKNFDQLDTYDKKNLIKFYVYINQPEKYMKILKHMLYKKEDILGTIHSLIELGKEQLTESDLFFIERIHLIKNNIKINFLLADIYRIKGLTLRAYERATNTLDYIEYSLNKEYKDEEFYYKLLIMVVQMEYEFVNFTQARFQLKKLINIPVYKTINYHEDIIYWSCVLGTIDVMLVKNDWHTPLHNIKNKEIEILVNTWINIYAQKLSINQYNAFKNANIIDKKLKEIAYILDIYIRKCLKDDSWEVDLKKMDPSRCYLTILLYYECMVNQDEDIDRIREFLKKYYEYHCDIYQVINIYSTVFKRKKRKELEHISMQFIGGANKIGGSCVLISYKGTNILLDAGANMNEDEYYPDFTVLNEIGITLKEIDYLVISHAHLDHIGSVPYIYKNNPNIKIISTKQTKDIAKTMLEDTLKISMDLEDIFNMQDIKNAMSVVETIEFQEYYKVNEDISISLLKAGHILGAASIYIKISGTNILYTGDYCLKNQNTVKGLEIQDNLDVDILITETTYANTPTNFKLTRENQEKLLVDSIKRTIDLDGVVLIPSFAVGRAQEIVLAIKNYYKELSFIPFDVYLDGKVVEICDIYERNNCKGIYGKGVSEVNDKEKKNNLDKLKKFRGSCIIASSGMLNKGSRSYEYASNILENENSSIFFSGYLDEESPGRQMLKTINEDIVPIVVIDGISKEIKCNIASYKLSAHATKEEILKLITSLSPKYTFLVHGDTKCSYRYLGDEEIGECIYPSIETLTHYITDLKVIKPSNGDVVII